MASPNRRVGRLNNTARSYRGHGDSDKPANRYTLDGFAKDVLAVADAAGAQRFVLRGFSMSGKFAQYIAAVHPFTRSVRTVKAIPTELRR